MRQLTDRHRELVLLGVIGIVVFSLVALIPFRLFDDDLWFRYAVDVDSLPALAEFLSFRFHHWSSRTVIEAVLVTVVRDSLVWRLMTALAFFVAIVVPPRFLARTPRARMYLTLANACLVAAVPLKLVFETGYVATSTNYLWPYAAGVLAAWPAVNRLTGVTTKPAVHVLAAVGSVYAVSSELMAAVLVLVHGVAIGAMVRQRRPWAGLAPYAALAVAGVGVALLAPGNANRSNLEIDTWFPTYADLSLFRRFEMGYSSTLRSVFLSGYVLPLVLCALVLILVIVRRGRLRWSLVAVVPLVAGTLLGLNRESRVPSWIDGHFTDYGLLAADRPGTWFAFLFLTALLASLTTAVVGAFRGWRSAFPTLLIVYVGFFTRFILGFSPTVWASGARTDTFLLLAFALASLTVLAELGRAARSSEAMIRW